MNIDLLTKVLGMLGSSNDAEVLSAARRAHAMVNGTGWAALLRAPAVKEDVDVAKEEVPLRKQIMEAFKEMGADAIHADQNFVDLLAKFRREGYLSKAERAPLFEAVKLRRKI